MTLNTFLTAVADSIREKKGTTGKIKALEFPTEILTIQGGTGAGSLKLHTPSISLDSAQGVLTISDTANGAFVDCYELYVNSTKITELTTKTINLSNYIHHIQTIPIKVLAKGEGFENSDFSNVVEWVKINYDGTEGLAYTIKGSGDSAYATCTGIGTATDSEIEIASFYNDIPVTTIAESAFNNNTNITKVVLGVSITTLGGSAFKNCSNLTEIIFNGQIINVGNYCFEGSGLINVNISTKFPIAGRNAFSKCTSLVSIRIKDKADNTSAFDYYYFSGCTNLKRIDLSSFTAIPAKQTNTFSSVTHADLQIKVPVDLFDSWKNSGGWSDVADKIVTEFTNTI